MLKKSFKFYFILWAIAVAIFNLCTFLPEWNIDRLEEGGWIGYGFIMLGFVIQLGCAFYALGTGSAEKIFYRAPLVGIGYSVLAIMLSVGSVCMIVNILPIWLATLICIVPLLYNIVAVVKGVAVASYVEGHDKNIKDKTLFIKSLTVNAEGVIARAATPELSAEAKKVYEAVRYSDPMSSDALSSVEGQISVRFNAFANAVAAKDLGEAKRLADEIVILIGDRNKTCKLIK